MAVAKTGVSVFNWLQKKLSTIVNDDKVMMSSLPYYSTCLLLLTSHLLIWKHPWLVICILNVLVPLLDELFPKDTRSPNKSETA